MLLLNAPLVEEACTWCDGQHFVPAGAVEFLCRWCEQITVRDTEEERGSSGSR